MRSSASLEAKRVSTVTCRSFVASVPMAPPGSRLCAALCLLVLCGVASGDNSSTCNVSLPCSDIFCGQGGFLQAANQANIFSDPKSIVDLPLRNSSNVTISAFQQLQAQNGGNASAGM